MKIREEDIMKKQGKKALLLSIVVVYYALLIASIAVSAVIILQLMFKINLQSTEHIFQLMKYFIVSLSVTCLLGCLK